MAYKKILVAYDGSDHSRHALDAALEMVDHSLAEKIIVLSIEDALDDPDPTFEIAARMATVTNTSNIPDLERKLSESIAGQIKGHEGIVEPLVKLGKPHSAIVATAKDYGCDMIVMGSRGLGAIRGMLGSVSASVLHEADIPVFITK